MENTMKKRWMKRRLARGVAMVEGGILAPIFAMMMMLTVYLGGVYQAKYRSFEKERFNTWSYASGGCTTSVNGANTDQPATPPQNPPSDPCNQQSGAAQSSASSSMFTAHGTDQEEWSYSPTLRFNNNQIKYVHTDGYMVCNEKAVPGGIFASLGGQLGSMFNQIKGGNSPCN
jgi:hypothetical protein